MQRIIKKILVILILIVIMFEFTCSSNICYAAFDITGTDIVNSVTNLLGGITAIVLWIPRIIVTALAWGLDEIMTFGFAYSCGINFGSVINSATPFDIFFNKYKIFDVNFFDIGTTDNVLNKMRGSVAEWFYILRLLATSMLLCILVYVGIRMAISTVADDKAKYKKMLVDWSASLALMFLLPYIIIFTITANNAIVSVLKNMTYNDISSALDKIAGQAILGMGIGSLVATFVYCMIVFQTIAFMLTYMQRMLKVGFLIMISPLISITYSIDKIGDGKAQALNTWLKEFVYTILIQPFHCVMYLAFVNTAIGLIGTSRTLISGIPILSALFNLADGTFNQLVNGILAILCLKFINDGEKAIRKIFNFKDSGDMTSMAFGAALAMSTINNAKKIGNATATVAHKATGIYAKFTKARERDKANPRLNRVMKQFNNTKLGGKVNSTMNKLGGIATVAGSKLNSIGTSVENTINKVGRKIASKMPSKETIDRVKNSKAGKTLGKGAKFVGKGVRSFGKEAKRSMPLALGMMGAAMSYATGSSGVLEAIGVGSGLQKGSDEFFKATKGTIADDSATIIDQGTENACELETMAALKDSKDNFEKDSNIENDKQRVSSVKGENATDLDIRNALEEPDIQDYTEEEKRTKTKDEITDREQEIEVQQAKKDMAMKLGLASANSETQSLAIQRFLEKYRSLEGVQRAGFVSNGKNDIMNKKNEILKRILDLKSKSRPNDSISDDDVDYADRTMSSITDAIDFSVKARRKLNINELIESQTGEEADYSDEYQSLYLAALQYDSMIRASELSENMSMADSVELDDDKVYEAIHRRVARKNNI